MKINVHRVLLGFFENWDKSPQKKSPESAAKEEIKSKSSMPKCGIIRGMKKSTKSAVAITLAIAGAIASPFSSNAAALDLRGGG